MEVPEKWDSDGEKGRKGRGETPKSVVILWGFGVQRGEH